MMEINMFVPGFAWFGIGVCLFHSALFSGMTLGVFGVSRLKLEVQAEANDLCAVKILSLRKDANLLLATLLWGNVGVNVLLTLLTESVLTGIGAFFFSTFFITILGEIVPQAYLSRYALKSGVFFVPLIHVFRFLLYPVAKPTAWLLDVWLGKEGISYFKEEEIKILIQRHLLSSYSNVDRLEGLGAINFLALDDVPIEREGETIHPASLLSLPTKSEKPVFPNYEQKSSDSFLQKVYSSNKKWVVILDEREKPVSVLDSDQFLRDVFLKRGLPNPMDYCHEPVVVTMPGTKLGEVIDRFQVQKEHKEDDVIDKDVILYWNEEKRIITGSDILGRLLRGIVK